MPAAKRSNWLAPAVWPLPWLPMKSMSSASCAKFAVCAARAPWRTTLPRTMGMAVWGGGGRRSPGNAKRGGASHQTVDLSQHGYGDCIYSLYLCFDA